MSKNSLINIIPKKIDQAIKAENFSNTKKTLLLSSTTIDESIYDSIKSSYENQNNLSLKDKEIVLLILTSYQKRLKNINLDKTEFILTKNEINEFLSLEKKNILRYVIYRYKYIQYPKLKILEEYPPNIQIEPTSLCNLRCIMCYQSDKSFSSKSAGFMGYMKLDLLKKLLMK